MPKIANYDEYRQQLPEKRKQLQSMGAAPRSRVFLHFVDIWNFYR
jgi:hypothetical protein